ncbi:MAG: dethiobiotin synthase [Candidatus Accumulibacter sp.]|jgi:dethiobiotin synthetase|nr:dethiobiotin synthase [Accumulibacter sp.]
MTAKQAKSAWFIAGTDTEIGKTFSATTLLYALKNAGVQAVGMKPVAAGTDSDGKNDDVESLAAASGIAVPRALLNPCLFHPAIAPHIAADEAGRPIEIEKIVAAFNALREIADAVVVEGVGGFRVPLGTKIDARDLAQALGVPVILVVGMRLGCISHALLTVESIAAADLTLAGWIANRIDPDMPRFEENLDALKARIDAPLLGVLPALSTPQAAAAFLRIPRFGE